MSETITRRGRPKGSGIDDRQRLNAIARLITSNPELKPTTAIRTLGVSDPSVIRRLRDKFNAVRSELMNELKDVAALPPTGTKKRTSAPRILQVKPQDASFGTKSANRSTTEKAPRTRSIAATAQASNARITAMADGSIVSSAAQPQAPRSATRTASTPPKPCDTAGDDDGDRHPAQSKMPAEATDMLTSIFSAGVAATNTLMAAHTTMANEFFRSPYMSLALRQQLAFSEWAVGLVPSFQIPIKTAT